METSEFKLTPEQEMDLVIYQIRDYARSSTKDYRRRRLERYER